MLSRTADHLFWMSRYIERAENLARLLDVTWQMSMVPQALDTINQSWAAIIALNSLEEAYAKKYSTVNGENVLKFMVSDPDNFASIHSCLRMARENAHAVRGTLTTEMWETLNATWLETREKTFDQLFNAGIGDYFEWVKMRSSLSRGTTLGTLLQDEAYHFIRLGTLLERADNTARILDVKYHVLRPHDDEGATDFYEWGALLRSVSAFEVYRKVYRDVITPERVAELLIFNKDMPRSLQFCLNSVSKNLDLIANSNSGETQRQAGMLNSQLRYGRIEDILEHGLHAWLSDFMDRIYLLGNGISKDFLVPMEEAA
ncbi:MAG: alpha-E domain-containing protein [Gammaproteobacteria bacterium]|nr:alpha-E domain-containing protein [Gammaproteobacteria bacterium]MBU1601553.1 alpha-E domain-containing protein [Gammaproteobacteria bacterium]MBU2433748.1 alpha-E domain-containing protein [Gammaproteobacteria bacterium]MBU2449714.1 alpha-E domain-containing protein [Gammaproteobacteria bacterium]